MYRGFASPAKEINSQPRAVQPSEDLDRTNSAAKQRAGMNADGWSAPQQRGFSCRQQPNRENENAAMEKAAVALRKWFAYLISKTLMGDGTPYAVCGAPVITEHGMLASGRPCNEDEMYGTHAAWLAHPCRCRLMGYIYLE